MREAGTDLKPAPPAAQLDAGRPAAPRGRLCGWGRLCVPGDELASEDLESASAGAVLSRGLGRSYGDASLPPPSRPIALGTRRADRLRSFDATTGVLRAEAGLALLDVNRLFLFRGFRGQRWFVPVTPGTQYVTLGGMVAADVHGKNHHRDGCFGRHVTSLRVRVADGRVVECSREREAELFRATIGGMGLIGHVLEVEFRMIRVPTPWIWCETEPIRDIDHYVEALKAAGPQWPYTVGWIDCLSTGAKLGRGLLMKGRFAEAGEAPARVPAPKRRVSLPFVLPGFALSRPTVRAFNALYHKLNARARRGPVHPESFFYPLDAVLHWNRAYGPRGFTQYQCVLPERAGRDAARRFLEVLTARGGASFLCVIKDCGDEGDGTLSFPMRGISIALDIPVRDDTQQLVDALNERVIAEGGRVYLAKDAFTRAAHFARMEPRLAAFEALRDAWDPARKIRSALSVRLFGDPS